MKRCDVERLYGGGYICTREQTVEEALERARTLYVYGYIDLHQLQWWTECIYRDKGLAAA